MILNPFRLRLAWAVALAAEADDLEARLGAAGALLHVREQIASAERGQRPRLYRLHDEIMRRYPNPAMMTA